MPTISDQALGELDAWLEHQEKPEELRFRTPTEPGARTWETLGTMRFELSSNSEEDQAPQGSLFAAEERESILNRLQDLATDREEQHQLKVKIELRRGQEYVGARTFTLWNLENPDKKPQSVEAAYARGVGELLSTANALLKTANTANGKHLETIVELATLNVEARKAEGEAVRAAMVAQQADPLESALIALAEDMARKKLGIARPNAMVDAMKADLPGFVLTMLQKLSDKEWSAILSNQAARDELLKRATTLIAENPGSFVKRLLLNLTPERWAELAADKELVAMIMVRLAGASKIDTSAE